MEKLNKVLQLIGAALNAIGWLHFYAESYICTYMQLVVCFLCMRSGLTLLLRKKKNSNMKISDTTGSITSLKEFARLSFFKVYFTFSLKHILRQQITCLTKILTWFINGTLI